MPLYGPGLPSAARLLWLMLTSPSVLSLDSGSQMMLVMMRSEWKRWKDLSIMPKGAALAYLTLLLWSPHA